MSVNFNEETGTWEENGLGDAVACGRHHLTSNLIRERKWRAEHGLPVKRHSLFQEMEMSDCGCKEAQSFLETEYLLRSIDMEKLREIANKELWDGWISPGYWKRGMPAMVDHRPSDRPESERTNDE